MALYNITDAKIADEAKRRYPYPPESTESRINKLSSKRRRFIEGAQWMQTECAKDMEGEAIGFAEWIKNSGWKPNSNPNYWYHDDFDLGQTTADLLTLYRESLKK